VTESLILEEGLGLDMLKWVVWVCIGCVKDRKQLERWRGFWKPGFGASRGWYSRMTNGEWWLASMGGGGRLDHETREGGRKARKVWAGGGVLAGWACTWGDRVGAPTRGRPYMVHHPRV
jgi:hypothetical protein